MCFRFIVAFAFVFQGAFNNDALLSLTLGIVRNVNKLTFPPSFGLHLTLGNAFPNINNFLLHLIHGAFEMI